MALGSGSSTVAITSIASSLLIDSLRKLLAVSSWPLAESQGLRAAIASKLLDPLLSPPRSVRNGRCSFRQWLRRSTCLLTRGHRAGQNSPWVQSPAPCLLASEHPVR